MLFCDEKGLSSEDPVDVEPYGFCFKFFMIWFEEQCPCQQFMVEVYKRKFFELTIGIDIKPLLHLFRMLN